MYHRYMFIDRVKVYISMIIKLCFFFLISGFLVDRVRNYYQKCTETITLWRDYLLYLNYPTYKLGHKV